MYVTSAEQRAGLLVAVVSGGRPLLKQRPTRRFLDAFDTAFGGFGCHGPVWVVSSHEAHMYEQDGHEMVVFDRDWAVDYAQTHWSRPELPGPDAYLGACVNREWACIEAEKRGCWGVLMLDDNIVRLAYPRGAKAAIEIARRMGGLAGFGDLIAGVTLSTNGWMVGANLDAVISSTPIIARAGFPYSVFIARTGPEREHWIGPVEEDIIYAYQYGSRPDGTTAAMLPLLRYMKEHKQGGGMRPLYDDKRALQLQRMFPESAKMNIRKTRANGKGGPRVFHTMLPGAIRNPLRVHDPELFGRVKKRMEDLLIEWHALAKEMNRQKVEARVTGKPWPGPR
jgi:hypothetical protein